eukprot:scaffold118860_cov63-Phaeocystis_antarctica.AAC.4
MTTRHSSVTNGAFGGPSLHSWPYPLPPRQLPSPTPTRLNPFLPSAAHPQPALPPRQFPYL